MYFEVIRGGSKEGSSFEEVFEVKGVRREFEETDDFERRSTGSAALRGRGLTWVTMSVSWARAEDPPGSSLGQRFGQTTGT